MVNFDSSITSSLAISSKCFTPSTIEFNSFRGTDRFCFVGATRVVENINAAAYSPFGRGYLKYMAHLLQWTVQKCRLRRHFLDRFKAKCGLFTRSQIKMYQLPFFLNIKSNRDGVAYKKTGLNLNAPPQTLVRDEEYLPKD